MVENIEIVVDASVLLSFLMPDEKPSSEIRELVEEHVVGNIQLVAPNILPFEVANALNSGILSKRITLKEARNLFRRFIKIEVLLMESDFEKIQVLANQFKISIYDASYLELTVSKKIRLISIDEKLAKLSK